MFWSNVKNVIVNLLKNIGMMKLAGILQSTIPTFAASADTQKAVKTK